MNLPFLQEGDEGASVSALKLALAALGFDVGTVNETFDSMTTSAVRNFQDAQGIAASGSADDETWAAIGGQQFAVTERMQINAAEFPSVARAIFFADNFDGYLQDLGIDPATIVDDTEDNA